MFAPYNMCMCELPVIMFETGISNPKDLEEGWVEDQANPLVKFRKDS